MVFSFGTHCVELTYRQRCAPLAMNLSLYQAPLGIMAIVGPAALSCLTAYLVCNMCDVYDGLTWSFFRQSAEKWGTAILCLRRSAQMGIFGD